MYYINILSYYLYIVLIKVPYVAILLQSYIIYINSKNVFH